MVRGRQARGYGELFRSATSGIGEHRLNTVKRSPDAQNENWANSIAQKEVDKNAMLFIVNLQSFSQAGSRRFTAGKCGLSDSENLCPQALLREIPSCSTVGGLSVARILPSASRMSFLDPSVWLTLITV